MMATNMAVFDTWGGVRRLACPSLDDAQRFIESLRPPTASWWLGRVIERDEYGHRVWILIDGIWTYEKRL